MIETLDVVAEKLRKQNGLKCVHPDLTHQQNRVRCQVAPPALNMRTDHRHKTIVFELRREQVPRRKFGVIGNRISARNLELDPDAPPIKVF